MKKIVLTVVSVLLMAVGLVASLKTADAAPGDPVISGTGRVGDTLTISSYGSIQAKPADLEYTWLWEGEEVPGPRDHDASHTVTPDDVGRELSVLVKPRRGERLVSNRIVGIQAALVAPEVAVAGPSKVGRTLTASLSGGTAGATVTIQWLRDGAPVRGATRPGYRVAKADGGRTISARAVSVRGDEVASRDSAARRVAAHNVARPKVTGAAKVHKRLKVKTRGKWYAPGHRYRFQWLRNGATISRATKSSYKLTAKDRGKRISVVVRATKSRFPTVSATSPRTRKVR